MDGLLLVGTAIIAFLGTTIDYFLLLLIFFADNRNKTIEVFIGFYAAFLVIIAVSLLAAASTISIPEHLLGLLGLLPIIIGITKIFDHDKPSVEPLERKLMLSPRMYMIAAITLANSGDNFGTYIPLFATQGLRAAIAISMLFLPLIAILCALAHILVKFSPVAKIVERYGRIIVPILLIVLGAYIMWESETIRWIVGMAT